MNFGPAQTQQKIMLVTGIIVILIIAFGSWYAVQQVKRNSMMMTDTSNASPTSEATVSNDFIQGGELVVRVKETTDSPNPSGATTYVLTVAPTQVPLTGLSLKVSITNASNLTTQLSSFSTSSSLAGTGWQSMANATETSANGMTVELSLLNLSPEGWVSGQPLEIGMISFKAEKDASSQFTIDQESSSAFTKDGQEMKINLIMEPKATE